MLTSRVFSQSVRLRSKDIKNIFLVVLIGLFAFNAQARTEKGVAGSAVGGFNSQQQFLAIMNNSSEEARKALKEELLGVQGPSQNWPGFPRTWTQFKTTTFQDTNTSLGLTVNAISQNLGLGALTSLVQVGVTAKPLNISYSYTFDTTLVVISSYRANNLSDQDKQKIIQAQDQETLRTIFDLDPKTNKNYFKVSDGYPVVGFCIIEATLKHTVSSEYGIKYLVGESSISSGKIKTVSHALYSNFFPIEKHVPLTDYEEVKCGDAFLTMARPFVEADFNKLIVELNVHNNPKSSCVPEPDGRPEGDNNCLAWHKQNFPALIQKITVPRCITEKGGVSRCRLRSKKGSSCPLYLDRSGQITDKFQLYRDATITGFSYTCDNGLKCGLDSDPWTLFNKSLILWPGTSSCK